MHLLYLQYNTIYQVHFLCTIRNIHSCTMPVSNACQISIMWHLDCLLNSLWLINAISWHRWHRSSLDQVMACCLMAPKPMWTNHQWGLVAFSWGQFHRKCSRYLSSIQIRKLPIQDYSCMSRGANMTLVWHHNGHDGVSNHQPHNCLLKRSYRPRSKKTSKLHVNGLCARNSPVTG